MKIALIDSGVGGLAVLPKLFRMVPADYIYFADTAALPYGNKTVAEIRSYAKQAVETVTKAGAEAVVLACNTLSLCAANYLSKQFPDTVIFGCEPPVLHACEYTASNVLVAATVLSVEIMKSKYSLPNVVYAPMPLLAEMVEFGADNKNTARYIESNIPDGTFFDCIVLGCTHYSLCRDAFSMLYPAVKIFDSADGVAQRVRKFYRRNRKSVADNTLEFMFTSDIEKNTEKYSEFAREILKIY